MSISSTGLYGSATIVNSDLFNDVEDISDVPRALYEYPLDWGVEFSRGIFALGRTPGC